MRRRIPKDSGILSRITNQYSLPPIELYYALVFTIPRRSRMMNILTLLCIVKASLFLSVSLSLPLFLSDFQQYVFRPPIDKIAQESLT